MMIGKRYATSQRLWPLLGALVLLVVIGFLVLWPLLALEAQSLKGGVAANYLQAFSEPGIGTALVTTIELALFGVVISLVLGTLLAWCALRLPPSVAAILRIVPLMPLLIPGIASVVGWIFLLSPRVGYLNVILRGMGIGSGNSGPLDIYTFSGMVFTSSLLFTAFIYLFASNGLSTMSPEYEEAAATSGASPLRTFVFVTMALLRPSLSYGAGIVLMLALGQFAVPALLGGPSGIEVLTTRIFSKLELYPIPFGMIAALGMPLLFTGLLVLLGQRAIIGDIRKYKTVAGRAQRNAREPSWIAAAVIFIYGVLAVVLPLLALFYTSLSAFWSGRIRANVTIDNYITVFSDRHFLEAIVTSVTTSVIAIIISVALGYFVARVIAGRTRSPAGVAMALDILMLVPFVIPAVLLGFALLFAYSEPPFYLYGTQAIIVVSYCTIMIPYAARLLLARLMALGEEPWEAAYVHGAGPIRTAREITFALMRPAAAAAAAVIFILLFQEFGVSLLVRSASTQVIGGVLYDQFVAGSYPNVAVLAVLMVAITALSVVVLLAAGGGAALRQANKEGV